MNSYRLSALFLLVAALAAFPGCGDTKTDDKSSHPAGPNGAAGHKAPHGGHIIELGRDHKYHAELVDDDKTETVQIYILDADLKELPIEATSVELVLTASGKTDSHELAAATSNGPSSRFDAASEAVFDALHAKGASVKLRVNIDGATHVGTLEHEGHDHEGHEGHDHGDDDDDHKGHDHGPGEHDHTEDDHKGHEHG